MAGALIAAIAAIAGLWFQAVATYWSQETAKDQLQQSKEDGERQDREQALRVAYWVEGDQSFEPRVIHVINRSLDPVTNVKLIIEGTGVRDAVYQFSEVRPCAEILLPDTIMETDRGTTLRDWDWRIREIAFTDRTGRGWRRTSASLVSDSKEPDWLHSIGEDTKKAPQILDALNCGDSEK
ncbi:hypothetical protein ACGFZQ_52165 [Streptomyces sp. NPDC048254]|uniref:hypothetical protein n=1 Tax=Streptomyces sp. NPDC048254 TaxID=3365525 RepID=UPI00371C14C3